MNKTDTKNTPQEGRTRTAVEFDWVTLDADGRIIDGSLRFAPSFIEKAQAQHRRQAVRRQIKSWALDIPVLGAGVVTGLVWGVLYCFNFVASLFESLARGLCGFVAAERQASKRRKQKTTDAAATAGVGVNVNVSVQS